MQVSGKAGSTAARILLVLLAILAGIVALSRNDAPARRLDIVASAAEPGMLQVFFDTGDGFNEAQSERVRVGKARAKASVKLPASRILRLRIDPSPKLTWLRLHDIRMAGTLPSAGSRLSLSDLQPAKDVLQLGAADGYVEARMAGGGDPQLFLALDDPAGEPSRPTLVAEWLGSAAAAAFWLLALLAAAACLGHRDRPVPTALPWMLAIAGVLVLAMAFAATTEKSVHPDEFHHVIAAVYYFNHWLPAAAGDPAMVSTYDTIWGISYLNGWDVAYFLAAKSAGLWHVVTSDPIVALRLFNVLLLVLLAVFASLRKEYAAAISALVLTPQAWYVFAYFNGDAFPLFLSMLAVALVASRENAVSRFIREGGRPTWPVVLFVVAVGLLLVSKQNYLVVVFFIGMLLTWRHLKPPALAVAAGFAGAAMGAAKAASKGALGDVWPDVDKALALGAVVLLGAFAAALALRFAREAKIRPAFGRMVLVFMLTGAVAMPRVAADLWVNGSPGEKAEQVVAAAEKYARVPFKPSTIRDDIDSARPGLRYAKRGVPLSQMLWKPRSWIEKTWRSSFGVYGYMSVRTPTAMYWLLTLGMLVVVMRALAYALGRRPVDGREAAGTAWIALGSLALVVISSISFSWLYNVQAQGRYLLPAIPMLGAIIAASVDGGLKSRIMPAALIACFGVSVLSFVIAIGKIP